MHCFSFIELTNKRKCRSAKCQLALCRQHKSLLGLFLCYVLEFKRVVNSRRIAFKGRACEIIAVRACECYAGAFVKYYIYRFLVVFFAQDSSDNSDKDTENLDNSEQDIQQDDKSSSEENAEEENEN
jgi:hypothetical protein